MLLRWMRKITAPLRLRILSFACNRLKSRQGRRTSLLDVSILAIAWGNPGYAAGFSYLQHISERTSNTKGTILECGSGATTLLIGSLLHQEDRRIIVLEHDQDWHAYLSCIANQLGLDNVTLLHTPLVNYGNFEWYDIEKALDEECIEKDIGLVICDGPPGKTPGGRYGLMPIAGGMFSDHCVVLLDDTHRKAEQTIIENWRREYCPNSHQLRFKTHTEIVSCRS